MSNEIAQYQEQLPATGGTLFFDIQRFEHAQRIAKLLASSTMVPAHFRDNIGNCLIALNYAERLGADPFMVMQRMYVIQGKPGIEGQLIIALVNQSGRFDPLQFEERGNINTPEKDTDGVYAYATERRSGKILEGPIVDWATVKNEGWYNKSGSKWKTIAPLMFRYRAATFFARIYCPEVLLGMHTVEELRDVYDMQRNESGAWAGKDQGEEGSLTKRLLNAVPDPESKSEAEPEATTEKSRPEPKAKSRSKKKEPEQPAEKTAYQVFDELQKADPSGIDEAMFATGFSNEPASADDLQKIIDKYHEMKAA